MPHQVAGAPGAHDRRERLNGKRRREDIPLPAPEPQVDLADFCGCLLDGLVDILRTCIELLCNMLVCLQLGLVDRIFDGAFTDDRSAASLASIKSPNSLTSLRDIPRHRWPLIPPIAPPVGRCR